jgi:hypothetical protein
MDIDTHPSTANVPENMSRHFGIETNTAVVVFHICDNENGFLNGYFQIRHFFTSSPQTWLIM